jgi:hypothetical protein
MKWLLLVGLICTNAMATEVTGKIFYSTPEDELAVREMTLEVPSRGEGEVVLRGKKVEWKTNKFHSHRENGRTLFVADFDVERNGKKKIISFRGTYLRTSDQVLYYGDFYRVKKCHGHKPPHDGQRPPHTRLPNESKPPRHGHGDCHKGNQKHLGGFYFSYTR